MQTKVVTLQSQNEKPELDIASQLSFFIGELENKSVPTNVIDTYVFVINLVAANSDREFICQSQVDVALLNNIKKSFRANFANNTNPDWILYIFFDLCTQLFGISVSKVCPSGFTIAETHFLTTSEMETLKISDPNCFKLSLADRKALSKLRLEIFNSELVNLLTEYKTKRDKQIRSVTTNSKISLSRYKQAVEVGFVRGDYAKLLSNRSNYFHFIYRHYKEWSDFRPSVRCTIRERIGISSHDEKQFLLTVFPNETIIKAVRLILNSHIKLKSNWQNYLLVDNINKVHKGYNIHFYEITMGDNHREIELNIKDKGAVAAIRLLENCGKSIRGVGGNLLTHLSGKGIIHDGSAKDFSTANREYFRAFTTAIFGVRLPCHEGILSNSARLNNTDLKNYNPVNIWRQVPTSKQFVLKIKGHKFNFTRYDFASEFLLNLERHLNLKDIEYATLKSDLKSLRKLLDFCISEQKQNIFRSLNKRSLETLLVDFKYYLQSLPLMNSSKSQYFKSVTRSLKEMIKLGMFPNILVPRAFSTQSDNRPKTTYLNLSMKFIKGEKDALIRDFDAPETILYTQITDNPELVFGVLNYRVQLFKIYCAKLICKFRLQRDKALSFANGADLSKQELSKRINSGESFNSIFPKNEIGKKRVYLLFSMGDNAVITNRQKLSDSNIMKRLFGEPHAYYMKIYAEFWLSSDIAGACLLLLLLEIAANPTHIRDLEVSNFLFETDDPKIEQLHWKKKRGKKDTKIADLIIPEDKEFSEHNPSALLCLKWLKDLQLAGEHKYLFFCRTNRFRPAHGPRFLTESCCANYAVEIGLGKDAVNGRIIRNTVLNLEALKENISTAQHMAGHESDRSTFNYMSKEYWRVTADLSIREFLEKLQVLVLHNSETKISCSIEDYDLRLENLKQSGLGIFCRDIMNSPYETNAKESVCGALDKCMSCKNRSPVFIATLENVASIISFKAHIETEKDRLMHQNSGRWMSTWAYYEAYVNTVIERLANIQKYKKMLSEARKLSSNYTFPRLW